VEPEPRRITVTVAGKIVANTRAALVLRERGLLDERGLDIRTTVFCDRRAPDRVD